MKPSDINAPTEGIAPRLSATVRVALAMSTGMLLGLACLFPACFALAWVGFIPLLIALRGLGVRVAYGLGTVAGFTLFALCAYWMVDFVERLKGYELWVCFAIAAAYWLYMSQLLAIVAVLTAWLRQRFALLLVFPLVVTAVFAAFPSLFSGQVGETQSAFLAATQATSITGVYGLDFVIALVNVLIVQAFFSRHIMPAQAPHNRVAVVGTAGAYGLVAIWFSYGIVSLQHWDQQVQDWERVTVGLVQPHEMPSTAPPDPRAGYTRAYSVPVALSEPLAAQSVDVIIWPEQRLQYYFSEPHVQTAFHRHVKQWRTPLVFQDRDKNRRGSTQLTHSASVLINAEGKTAGRYEKIKRIPIAEYLPVFGESDAAKDLLRRWLGPFFGDFSAGAGPAVFEVDGFALIPLICYEVMFPQFVADAVSDDTTSAMLLGQSNNGWFGHTQQPYQHLHLSTLRSVENRLPMVHAVNNGPSAVVLPSGRLHFRSNYRQGAAYVLDVPVSGQAGGSFYSRHPGLMISAVYGLLALLVFWSGMPESWRRKFEFAKAIE